jgi:arylsulfatase A-like enzyme
MDFLPTFARIVGVHVSPERPIDGKDVLPILLGEDGAGSPHETYLYYDRLQLHAVRKGKWKLFVRRRDTEDIAELYDLEHDIGEQHDVSADHPDIVAELQQVAAQARAELGDDATGDEGSQTRPCGKVTNARPLTAYDPSHPYIVAMYDLEDRG